MRRLSTLFLAALTILAASCTKDSTSDLNPKGRTVFTVSSADTKTAFGSLDSGVYPILWQKGDRIGVNGILSEALESETPGQTAVFTVNSAVAAPYDIVYPGSALDQEGKITFPSTQTYSRTQFDPNAQIMLAHSTTLNASLLPATAFIRVTINQGSETKLRSIKLYTYDGTPLGGKFTPDFTAGTLTFSGEGRNYITVTSTDGIAYEGGSIDAVFAVPAGEYAQGFAIAAVGESSGTLLQMGKRIAKFTSKNTTKLEAGKIYPMTPISFQDDGFAFSGGKGTEADPYKIATAEDLVYLSELTNGSDVLSYNGKHYIQMADIDMAAYPSFRAIANTDTNNTDKAFLGVYDGNGFTIENLHITATASYSGFVGFMGMTTGEKGEVKNLTFENCSINSTKSATGLVVGQSYLGKVTNCHLRKCTVTGAASYTGGIVGTSYYCDVKDCTVDRASTISSTGSYTGGIIGISYPTASLTNSCISCTVHGTVKGVAHVGGIIGMQWTRKKLKSTVKECLFTGKVTGTSYVGGITGGVYNVSYEAGHTFILSSCSTSAEAEIGQSGATEVGGIIGGVHQNITDVVDSGLTLNVEECSSSGSVTGTSNVGGIVGKLQSGHNTSVNKCTSDAKVKGDSNVGGIVGFIWANLTTNETISQCTFSGEIVESAAGKSNFGGIVGYVLGDTAYSSTSSYTANTNKHTTTVIDCTFDGKDLIQTKQTYVGGIVGRYLTYGSKNKSLVVMNCTSNAAVKASNTAGGLVGQCYDGASANTQEFKNCRVNGGIETTGNTVGGLAGYVSVKSECCFDRCASAAPVTGSAIISGLIGRVTTNASTAVFSVVNSGYIGQKISSFDLYNNYTLTGGIVGWAQDTDGKIEIANCFNRAKNIESTVGTNLGTAGIIGGTTGGTKATCLICIEGCYSSTPLSGYKIAGNAPEDTQAWGSMIGVLAAPATFTIHDSYWEPSTRLGKAEVSGDRTQAYADTASLLGALNAFVSTHYTGSLMLQDWVADTDSYPTVRGISSSSAAPKWRVSVIGDSISTFLGYIPSDYSYYYPRVNEDTGVGVTRVDQTYWHKFIYKYMHDAAFEKNIAYSGSKVTSTHDTPVGFIQRFRDRKMGNTNLIICNGLRNDYGESSGSGAGKIEFADGYTAQTLPPETVFNNLYAQAESDLENMDETRVLPAYIKLIKMMKNEYPDAKVILIIGDCLCPNYQTAIKKIADHYAAQGVRAVDFYDHGFNDKTNIPKVTGSHPNDQGAEYMARKMYTELKEWLE